MPEPNPAVSSAVAQSAPAKTALRDRIAEALHGDQTPAPTLPWGEELPLDREYFRRRADAVLSALPAPADRAAVLREAATIVRSMDSDYALQEAAEHLDGLAVEAAEEREAQAHLDALAPVAEGVPLPDGDGPSLYEKLAAMFSGPLPWPPPDSRPDLVTLRERIAEDLYAHDHPGWLVPLPESDTEPVYRERAGAVLAGLRALVAVSSVGQAAHTTRSAEDHLARVHEWVTSDVVTARSEFGNGYREAQRDIRDLLAGRRMADETQPAEEGEAHPPTHTWKVESPRRDKWASWGATHDERVWAATGYDDVIEVAPQRPFRLVRATTTYAVEAEHQPATEPAVGAQQPKEVRP